MFGFSLDNMQRDSDCAERDKRRAATIQIGDQVRVIQNDAKPWTADWPNIYIVVGIRLEYQKGACDGLNYSIAVQDEIEHRLGSTDGFSADDLMPVSPTTLPHKPPRKTLDNL